MPKKKSRATRRRPIWLILIVAGALVGGALAWFLVPRGNSELAGVSVYLLRDREVIRMDAATRETRVVTTLPSVEAASLDPTGSRLSWIPPAAEEGAAVTMSVRDLATGEDVEVGLGSLGVWNADGSALAYVEYSTEDPERLDVLVARAADDFRPERLLQDVTMGPVAWAGDRLVMFSREGEGALLEPGGAPEVFVRDIAGLWGVSPDGRWAIALDESRAPVAIDVETGARKRLGLEGWVLFDGDWRPGTSIALAPLQRSDTTGVATPRLVLIDPAAGSVTDLPLEGSAQGPVSWAPGGRVYSYATAEPGALQVCVLDGPCDELVQLTDRQLALGLV